MNPARATKEAAQEYAERAHKVFPVYAVDEFGNCRCRAGTACNSPGKHPAVSNWKVEATNDPNRAGQWFGGEMRHNIGLATGAASGVSVLDIDEREGLASFVELFGYSPENHPGYKVKTPRGWHTYFQYDPTVSENRVGLLPGLDFRSDGGYVVAPPSTHSSRKSYYEIYDGHTESAPLPESLRNILKVFSAQPSAASGKIKNGTRNAHLYRLGRGLHAKGVSRLTIDCALQKENEVNLEEPLGEQELERIIRQVYEQPDRCDFLSSQEGVNEKEEKLSLIHISALLSEAQTEISYVWDKIIAENTLNLLAAHPKAGKSTLAYALGLAISRGVTFLGHCTKESPVIFYSIEEPKSIVKKRLESFGAVPKDQIHLAMTRHPKMNEAISRLEQSIRQHPGCFVVIDTLGKFWNVKDENNNAEVQAALNSLIDLAHNQNCTILLIHHEKKNVEGGRGSGSTIRGASTILAAIDQGLILSTLQGGNKNRRKMEIVGRLFESPDTILFEFSNWNYQFLGYDTSDIEGNRNDQVKQVLSKTEGKGIKQICDEVGLKDGAVRKALSQLKDEIIEERGAGTGTPRLYKLR
ncbi:MAG TPA: bifunctional DNA primase/polymerase [Bdellovibrionota bacterium]|nr:bifunctional DNA primase/polymerase [Bdellovibrionota bacterium]